MVLRYALHEIRSGQHVVEPRTVADFTDEDLKSLDAAGAVREPSESELALYRMANPEPSVVLAVKKPGRKAAAADSDSTQDL